MSRTERLWLWLGHRYHWYDRVRQEGEVGGRAAGLFQGRNEGFERGIQESTKMLSGASRLTPSYRAERKRQILECAKAILQVPNPDLSAEMQPKRVQDGLREDENAKAKEAGA